MGTFKTKYTNSMGGHPKEGCYTPPPGGQTAEEILAESVAILEGSILESKLIEISINGRDYKGTLEQVLNHIKQLYK